MFKKNRNTFLKNPTKILKDFQCILKIFQNFGWILKKCIPIFCFRISWFSKATLTSNDDLLGYKLEAVHDVANYDLRKVIL